MSINAFRGNADYGQYRDSAEKVARELLGEPNKSMSKPGKEVRFGNRGSMKLDLAKGVFYDHETGEGGGVRWLVKRQTGISDEADVTRWLADRGYINAARLPNPQIVARYPYTDANDKLLFEVLRYEPKAFKQRKPDGRGGYEWNVTGISQVPYRLPDVIEAIKTGRPIIICEGEKDCDALTDLSGAIAATCNAGGAGNWPSTLSQHFRGAEVILIPDNDDAGRKHV
jgi:hypothetical protein